MTGRWRTRYITVLAVLLALIIFTTAGCRPDTMIPGEYHAPIGTLDTQQSR